MKRTALAIFAVFVLWSAMDFVIHGMVLASPYALTASARTFPWVTGPIP